MTSVVDRQSDILSLRKLHAGNHIIGSSDINGIHSEVTELTRLRCWCEWIARLILVVCVHGLRGFADATHPAESLG